MTEASPILDYASPRKRSKFRLASQSVLRVTEGDGEGGVRVLETLTGQSVAVGAIVFFLIAGTMMCVAGAEAGWMALAVLILFVGLPGLAVIPLVIQENWRRTVLTVGAEELRVLFWAPLRSREYRWPLSAVLSISVGLTQAQADAPVLGEIEVVADGSPVIKLFTDHGERELAWICDALNDVMASRSSSDSTDGFCAGR